MLLSASSMSKPRSVYVSFDRVPAPKGASVHIGAFSRALASALGAIDLVTVEPSRDDDQPSPELGAELWPGVFHHPLPSPGPNLIARALAFRSRLAHWWSGRRVPVVQFRSPFEGYPLACRKGEVADRLIYEVNGLPSIELKYHYPDVSDDHELLRKLRAQEGRCIQAADLLITPSAVTAAHLAERGADPQRVRVIPNGVDTELFSWREPTPWRDRCVHMVYSGTLTSWQGVPAALEALALYRRDFPARLTLAGPAPRRVRRQLEERCRKLGVSGQVSLPGPLSQPDLVTLLHEADVVVAPLLRNDRNLVQGCCPLKAIEAMAVGTPLIASDIPVLTDIARRDDHALLVKPGSGKAIKDAMLRLRSEPDLAGRLSRAARCRVEERFTWRRAGEDLVAGWRELL